ncbi:unnamed protein product [Protopolystoma xenopodis]|uniref:Uncharacterized protein n=1 Tax=Protopolystoma xenopodis TaxID=117903 RepID=A0A448WX29_9PLAT|nr:unnamed protein product [Protopolystoma xenopodis]
MSSTLACSCPSNASCFCTSTASASSHSLLSQDTLLPPRQSPTPKNPVDSASSLINPVCLSPQVSSLVPASSFLSTSTVAPSLSLSHSAFSGTGHRLNLLQARFSQLTTTFLLRHRSKWMGPNSSETFLDRNTFLDGRPHKQIRCELGSNIGLCRNGDMPYPLGTGAGSEKKEALRLCTRPAESAILACEAKQLSHHRQKQTPHKHLPQRQLTGIVNSNIRINSMDDSAVGTVFMEMRDPEPEELMVLLKDPLPPPGRMDRNGC